MWVSVCGQKPSVGGGSRHALAIAFAKSHLLEGLSGPTRSQGQWGLAHCRKSALRGVIKNLKSHLYAV